MPAPFLDQRADGSVLIGVATPESVDLRDSLAGVRVRAFYFNFEDERR